MQWYRVDIDLLIQSTVLATSPSTAKREAQREAERLVDYLSERDWNVAVVAISQAQPLGEGNDDE